MSKITNFFTPGTSSDAGNPSKVSSNSDKDNKDEDDEPPAKWSLKSTSCEATEERCASSKKSSVSSEDVYRIINDVFTEDQKKVLHHYHCCCERNCSSLGADEKHRLSSKKDKFQHEWLFEENVYCQKTGLRWLVFVEGEGMYCLICKKYKCTKRTKQLQREAFCEIQNDSNQRTWTVAETFGGNIMRDDEPSFCFPKGTG